MSLGILRRERTGGSSYGAFTFSTLDQKANIIVTLDGILLALTASFLGTALSRSIPLSAGVLFVVGTILVFLSAGACRSCLGALLLICDYCQSWWLGTSLLAAVGLAFNRDPLPASGQLSFFWGVDWTCRGHTDSSCPDLAVQRESEQKGGLVE